MSYNPTTDKIESNESKINYDARLFNPYAVLSHTCYQKGCVREMYYHSNGLCFDCDNDHAIMNCYLKRTCHQRTYFQIGYIAKRVPPTGYYDY
jgi:hypothetical protein